MVILFDQLGVQLDDLLDLVCTDIQADTVEQVQTALRILQEKVDTIGNFTSLDICTNKHGVLIQTFSFKLFKSLKCGNNYNQINSWKLIHDIPIKDNPVNRICSPKLVCSFLFRNRTCVYYVIHFVHLALAAEQTLNEGQSLLDQLALPVKNAFGKDITPDNKLHIAHVQKMMEDLQVRKWLKCLVIFVEM